MPRRTALTAQALRASVPSGALTPRVGGSLLGTERQLGRFDVDRHRRAGVLYRRLRDYNLEERLH